MSQVQERNFVIKKLLYQSKNRGCKETDLLLGRFADNALLGMTESELEDYASILTQTDADIVDWVTGKSIVPKELQNSTMAKLLDFSHHTFMDLD
jgi:antitoxin CptB